MNVIEVDEGPEGEGGTYMCQEEPHMVGHPPGPGFIPLRFGDKLHDGRYVIVRKLGYSLTSSVWLAKDVSAPTGESYVAIKVFTIEASNAIHSSRELEVLEVINRDTSHPGRQHCFKAQHVFVARSPHGEHRCVVTIPFSMSLHAVLEHAPFKWPPVGAVKPIIKRVLLALDFLHGSGYIHTDVKAENVIFSHPASNQQIAREIQGDPSETYPAESESYLELSPGWAPTAKSQSLLPHGLFQRFEWCLSEFGSAVPIEQAKLGMEVMSPLLRAPEVILHHPWSTPVDVWAVGYMVLTILTGHPVIDTMRTPNVTLTDVHLAQLAELLGPFPVDFLRRCARRSEYFDDSGKFLRFEPMLARGDTLEQRLYSGTDDERDIKYAGLVPEREAQIIAAFIRRCMALDPAARATIPELLAHEWLAGSP
ncbi:kinase-like domain-containing protein [Earliella scabrosa]|nr:kinase-like domain-containing protein [Earliella scabrosa]